MLSAIVRLAIESGVRLGELLSLRCPHIDLARRTAVLDDTKNGERLVVPLSSSALAPLSGLPRDISDNRVFWTLKRTDSFANAWNLAVSSAGSETNATRMSRKRNVPLQAPGTVTELSPPNHPGET